MSNDVELSDDDFVELSLLRDFEIDELIKAGFLGEDEQLRAPLDKEIIFKHDELDLHVTAGPRYPAVPVTWMIENYTVPRQVVDELRAQLRRIVEAAAVTNNFSKWKRREEENAFGVFEPTMVVLELAKKTRTHLSAWRQEVERRKPDDPTDKSSLPFKTKPESQILTISDVAKHYLQETPQEICSRIPSNYRILHVEEVIRVDLARKFQAKQEEMKEKLMKQPHGALLKCVPPSQQSRRKEVLVEHLVTPKVTFHGTARQFVPSIVRYGFLKPGKRNPGTNEVHGIRCGATYGRGIYSSPNPDFSLSYTGNTCHATKPNEFFGIKLLVCATLMGRWANVSRGDNWREQTEPYPGADSHVANRGLEYIVFDTAQILPVYVIHIDWGQDNASHFMDLPRDPGKFIPTQKKTHAKLLKNIRWPGDAQRAKAATLARAAKWFPYGYGPSTGSKFVVEEIGEVDEDEEEYGDYQELRGEDIKDKTNLDFWSWVKIGVEMDMAESGETSTSANEYTWQRHWHGPESSKITTAWDDLPDPRDNEVEDGHVEGDEDEDEDEDEDLGLGLLML
ncbi:hypothetical protein F5Y13DRAFT_170412 [Hypoxylon sp. FL1857]|nr:hypothetical protein F5Y13DRAFT_170412 [Hypoxylon sp. FL1857]